MQTTQTQSVVLKDVLLKSDGTKVLRECFLDRTELRRRTRVVRIEQRPITPPPSEEELSSVPGPGGDDPPPAG
ncbi:MAG: hypothetical protein HY532_08710 [Chloroflexi bacterium]|nr:hypothetical protein [Chloroflexota bacterium]